MKKLKFFFLIILVILLLYQSINYFCNDIKQNNTIKITISIDCSTILSNYSRLDTALQKEKYVPANGIILTETELYINEGDTVLDALKLA
ncbi:MAG: hypothetical protein IJ300_08735, partial [Clostridia bacterium]|nr:hypothetical protein [Clostridia bacterium]